MLIGSECIILSEDEALIIIKGIYALMSEGGTKEGYEILQKVGALNTFVDFRARVRSLNE